MEFDLILGRRASAIIAQFLNGSGCGRNGTILLPANCCPILPATLALAGCSFEFVDIDSLHLGMSAPAVLDRVQIGGVAGVLWVHAFGHVWEGILAFSRELKRIDPRVLLIDDRCLARPCFDVQNPLADLEVYSSGYSKFIDLGEGGWGFVRRQFKPKPLSFGYDQTSHEQLVDKFRDCINGAEFSMPNQTWLDERPDAWSWESHRDRVASKFHEVLDHRQRLAGIYRERLPTGIQLTPYCDDWRVNIVVDRPQALIEKLVAAGLFASRHYACLVPSFGPGMAPEASRIGSRIVNLFNDFRFTEEMAIRTCTVIQQHLEYLG